MAQRSTIHRVHIHLSDTERQVYEEIQISVARQDSETAHRLVARLLAYCLCYERDIAFTGGVGAGDEPDVWVKEPDDRVKAWIEVGLPDPKRLLKAARHCERVVLLAYGRRLPDWTTESVPLLEKAENVSVTGIELSFLDRLAERLDRTVNWELTVSGGTLYLTLGREQFETSLQPIAGPPLLPA
jgi:uncharacterized protein YaeQ